MSTGEDEKFITHIPVMAETLSERISLPMDGIMVDATVGHGGHSLLLGKQLGPEGTLLGLDVDEQCIERAQANISSLECRVMLIRANFSRLEEVLTEAGIDKVDFLLADLGFCSAQLEDDRRGLSFQKNMPLDMRLDSRLDRTAADIIKSEDETTLADLIYRYGEERSSRRIARCIVEQRRTSPIETTGQLASIICRALNQPMQGYRGRIHPATRTFQALRIAVNDELGALEQLLQVAPQVLRPDGKVAIITFHSLEDRRVKESFRTGAREGIYEVLTKKPLTATSQEVKDNFRARSAKLRMARRR